MTSISMSSPARLPWGCRRASAPDAEPLRPRRRRRGPPSNQRRMWRRRRGGAAAVWDRPRTRRRAVPRISGSTRPPRCWGRPLGRFCSRWSPSDRRIRRIRRWIRPARRRPILLPASVGSPRSHRTKNQFFNLIYYLIYYIILYFITLLFHHFKS